MRMWLGLPSRLMCHGLCLYMSMPCYDYELLDYSTHEYDVVIYMMVVFIRLMVCVKLETYNNTRSGESKTQTQKGI